MIYHLPTVRSSFNGFERLGQLASSTRDLKFDELILDMSEHWCPNKAIESRCNTLF